MFCLCSSFLSQAILSFSVSTLEAYLTIPPNKRKQTLPEIKNNYNISNMNWTNSFLDPSMQYFSVITCILFYENHNIVKNIFSASSPAFLEDIVFNGVQTYIKYQWSEK